MKNWKTTLLACLTGAGYLFLQALSAGVKPKDALLAIGIALLGTFCKDRNVTGGTVKQ